MIAALAIVVTALSAMLVYYNILKEQVFGDLKALYLKMLSKDCLV